MKNKIMKGGLKQVILQGVILLIFNRVSAQNLPVSAYGQPYINTLVLYHKSILHHPEKQMVSLAGIPGIILDLRYASTNNFIHKKLYPGEIKTTYLREPVYQALNRVSRDLEGKGFILVIFDAYRPYSVTEALWKIVKDDRYAANPAKGSGHNRGIAVDLSLADSKTHALIDMPTRFDNFSDSAHQNFINLDSNRIANRELLKRTMEKYGFIPLSTEWWHFSWPHPETFEVLDLSYSELTSLENSDLILK